MNGMLLWKTQNKNETQPVSFPHSKIIVDTDRIMTLTFFAPIFPESILSCFIPAAVSAVPIASTIVVLIVANLVALW